ncbi:MAG: S-adenosylmethionine:tRNA ribosyltransferase-isomerase [Marmoricola sp.]
MTTLTHAPHTRFLPAATASAPAERRGLARDEVRLLVATEDGIQHVRFRDLPDHLTAGDLLVVNDSATIAGQLDAVGSSLGRVVVHLASRLDDGSWVIEIRTSPDAARSVLDAEAGVRLRVGGVILRLREPWPRPGSSPTGTGNRLWRAEPDGDLQTLAERRGRPIAYGYLERRYPLSAYQSVFSRVPGSAEMPSAARPFTHDLVRRLEARGVGLAAITLHTGVSSQEAGEAPLAERFAVSAVTASQVNATRARGGRVVAVGTTVVRALESTVEEGRVVERSGWTERVIGPDEPAEVVDGLITGWHDPAASHLLLVESIAGVELTQRAYDGAVAEHYLWHEFGDSALLLPRRELSRI